MRNAAMQLAFGFEMTEPPGDARGGLPTAREAVFRRAEDPASVSRRTELEAILKRDPFPLPSPIESGSVEERGRALMRDIVRWVERNAPEPFALMQLSQTPEHFCGSHCEIYHLSLHPNAAAFTNWIERGKAYEDLVECGKYRLTFASAVYDSLRLVADLREEHGLEYSIDDTGAVVPPDSFRPEDALVAEGVYDGCKILQCVVRRGPRLYMDDPTWFGAGGTIARKARLGKNPRDMRHVRLGQGIHVWLELEPSREFLEEVALQKRGLKTHSPKFEMGR